MTSFRSSSGSTSHFGIYNSTSGNGLNRSGNDIFVVPVGLNEILASTALQFNTGSGISSGGDNHAARSENAQHQLWR